MDRTELERADRSLRSIRLFMRLVLLLAIGLGIGAAEATNGLSLIALPAAFVSWLLVEAGIIAARACVASAWAARTPDA